MGIHRVNLLRSMKSFILVLIWMTPSVVEIWVWYRFGRNCPGISMVFRIGKNVWLRLEWSLDSGS